VVSTLKVETTFFKEDEIMNLKNLIKTGVPVIGTGIAGLVCGQTGGQYTAQPSEGQAAQIIAFGDIDHEGDGDMGVIGSDGRLSIFLYNYEKEKFVERNDLIPKKIYAKHVAFFDIDRDGDVDMDVVDLSGRLSIFLYNYEKEKFIERSDLLPPSLQPKN
jgi:hypothetical protein